MSARDLREPIERAVPWAVFCVAYVFTYFVSTAVPVPLLWHLPVERRFTFEVRPLALGADFYGRVLLCLVVGGLAAGLAWIMLRGRRVHLRPEWLRGLVVWLVSLLLFTSALSVYVLRARQPIPATLPAGYVPR